MYRYEKVVLCSDTIFMQELEHFIDPDLEPEYAIIHKGILAIL